MPIIHNVSPIGDLDVPLLRCIVRAGEEVEVTKDQADTLLAQAINWQPAKKRTGTGAPTEENTDDDAA
ncbi:hypothetical protein [Arthrobacter sp. HLT1-20]